MSGKKPYLMGLLLAHTSTFSDADSNSRASAEADRLQALRGSVQELKNSAEQEFRALQDSGKVWLTDVEKELAKGKESFAAWQSATETGTKETIKELDSAFKKEIEALAKEHHDAVTEHQTIFGTMQKTFREQVRLQLPAEYWQKMEDDYRKEARRWLYGAIASGAVLALFAFILLHNPIPSLLDTGATLTAVRGALLTLVILSVGAYFVALFVRLTMSAQHLARDAKERLQLTHVYLALIKEPGAIDEKERDIIMQALFSRADTGLLKGDSSPTMPSPLGNLLDLLKNK
jgi:hypothetical protein